MVGFETANSTYFLNQEKRTIRGGRLTGELPYKRAIVVIGNRAIIELTTGDAIVTSEVKNYL